MDNKQVFDEQIKPLMDQVLEIAKQHKLPFVSTFQVSETEEGYGFAGVQNLNKKTIYGDIAPELHITVIARKAPNEAVAAAAMMLHAASQ
jgi:hypothetical protein